MRDGMVAVVRWFDSWSGLEGMASDASRRIDWLRCVPFIVIHLVCLAVLWVGWSWTAVGMAAALYVVRMFALTAFYHRYFSHRSFRTSRVMQFLFALLGSTAIQRGPLWWASHHRHHHRVSDQPEDAHSPLQHGFLYSHMGWFMTRSNFAPRLKLIRDFARYPELRFLDRFDVVVPVLAGAAVWIAGDLLARFAPGLGTSGAQLFVWGVISTVVLFHATFTINSLAHIIGRQRYATGDGSRNSWLLTLITLGEGWHNNHHHYAASARLGHRWWEFDPAHAVLRLFARVGLIWDLRGVPERVLATAAGQPRGRSGPGGATIARQDAFARGASLAPADGSSFTDSSGES